MSVCLEQRSETDCESDCVVSHPPDHQRSVFTAYPGHFWEGTEQIKVAFLPSRNLESTQMPSSQNLPTNQVDLGSNPSSGFGHKVELWEINISELYPPLSNEDANSTYLLG